MEYQIEVKIINILTGNTETTSRKISDEDSIPQDLQCDYIRDSIDLLLKTNEPSF